MMRQIAQDSFLSQQRALGMKHYERLMRNLVVIGFSVSSQANMEHVAAVRDPGGLQCPMQSCQIRFRPLTGCGSRRKAQWKWNHSISFFAEWEEGSDSWLRMWSRSAEWSDALLHSVHSTQRGRNISLDRLSTTLLKKKIYLKTFIWVSDMSHVSDVTDVT